MKSFFDPIKVEGRMRWLRMPRRCVFSPAPGYRMRGSTISACVAALKVSLYADHRLRGWKFDVDIQSPGGRRIKFKIPER